MPARLPFPENHTGEAPHTQVCRWLYPAKDSHRPDTTASLTGTSLCTYAVEPPCTERYARWCERSGLTQPLLLDFCKHQGFFVYRNIESGRYIIILATVSFTMSTKLINTKRIMVQCLTPHGLNSCSSTTGAQVQNRGKPQQA